MAVSRHHAAKRHRRHAGLAGLAGTQPLGTTGNLEIGWILAREAWGRGYATEAGGAAMRHVLETLARTRVVALTESTRTANASLFAEGNVPTRAITMNSSNWSPTSTP